MQLLPLKTKESILSMEIVLLSIVALIVIFTQRIKRSLSKRSNLIISSIAGFALLVWVWFIEPEVANHLKVVFTITIIGSLIPVYYNLIIGKPNKRVPN